MPLSGTINVVDLRTRGSAVRKVRYMHALVVDRSIPAGLRLGEVPDPQPEPGEALIRVSAFAVNRSEAGALLSSLPDGSVPGWECAGVIAQVAADGSGPAVGTPVVALDTHGGWAELRAVNTASIGIVHAGTDLGPISTVPVPGVSALRALHRLGPVLGRRVLVTGANGAVGRYAVQLARRAGAHVIAVTRTPEAHSERLIALGADDVVSRPSAVTEPVDGVIDVVGGTQLVQAYDLLAENGTLVSVGRSAPEPAVLGPGALEGWQRNNRSIVTFFSTAGPGLDRDLTWLASQVAAGELHTHIARRDDWSAADDVLATLRDGLGGKVVLDVTSGNHSTPTSDAGSLRV
jgi:NADPH:quinone reductase